MHTNLPKLLENPHTTALREHIERRFNCSVLKMNWTERLSERHPKKGCLNQLWVDIETGRQWGRPKIQTFVIGVWDDEWIEKKSRNLNDFLLAELVYASLRDADISESTYRSPNFDKLFEILTEAVSELEYKPY